MQEYWVDHVLAYASITVGRSTQDPSFNVHLEQLLVIFEQHRTHHQIGNSESPSHDLVSAQSSEPRLASLQYHGPVYKLISMIVQHRTVWNLHFKTNENGELSNYIVSNFLLQLDPLVMSRQDNEDPTPFSTVHSGYNKRVHALLTTDTFPGLTTLQLTTFKAVYGPYAFVCRYSGCSKTSLGFSSDELRVQHEKSHAPPLLCTHPGCTYTLRFQSLHGLKRHLRENHSELIRTVPKSIRHRSKASTAQSSTPCEALHSAIATMTEVVDPGIQPRSQKNPQKVVTMAPLSKQEFGQFLSCLWCNKKFKTLSILQDHQVERYSHHTLLSVYPLCAFCNREGFSSTAEYCRHLGLYHSKNPEAIDYYAHLSCLKSMFGAGISPHVATFKEEIMERQLLTQMIMKGSYDSTVEDKHHSFFFHRAYIQCLKRVFTLMSPVDVETTTAFTTLENYYISSASLVANMEQLLEDPVFTSVNISSSISIELTCLWCPKIFPSFSEVQDHGIETHEFEEWLDPAILCDYCLRMYGQESPFSTLQAYLGHMEQNHSGSPAATTQAIQYEAYLGSVSRFSSRQRFSNVDHHFAKVKCQRNIRSLKIQLANSTDDDKPKIHRDIVFNEACLETLDRLRPRLFKAIDASASVASQDARPPVHVDGLSDSLLDQNVNGGTR